MQVPGGGHVARSDVQALREASERWLTVPNVLSVLRLLGVPLFLWLLLGPKEDLLAFVVLALSGLTDWLDGKLARWLDQTSRLGAMLDPIADRLYIVATLVAFLIRDVVPWWVAAVLLARDLVLALTLPVLRRRGFDPPPVSYLGKAATFNLLYAFPLLLLATTRSDSPVLQGIIEVARPFAYAFTVWGGALYLWTAVLYLWQVTAALKLARAESRVG
ncbi:CDP-alcohol phosphatidyltransferase family protein [Pseudonocardiaceae bacterium YIM PH 21723]|nr:CDP-alcohol phosphatidyltransferase family protein [Pseudonocardiaceae bacterium YIM PH 21723]